MKLVYLGLADGDSFVTRPLPSATLTLDGLPGDRHAGPTRKSGVREKHLPRGTIIRNARQLSLLSEEELAATAAALSLPRIAPEWCGANLVFSGAPELTTLAPSTRLVFPSGVSLVIDGENAPCTQTGRAIARGVGDETVTSRYVKAAFKRRGLVAWVEKEGPLAPGDVASVHPR